MKERFGTYLLFAGRLSVEKGTRLLPVIAGQLPDVKILIAGEGPERAKLQQAAKCLHNLELLGALEERDMATVRGGAAVVLAPSLASETFCYSVAEGVLAGRPVVASHVGAIPELVTHGKTGVLVEPGDVDGFVAAIRDVLTWSPASGQEERAALAAELSPEQHIASLTALYRETISSRLHT
jgi:glycosyltransferase involved in cell wall biosynthesis